MNSHLPDTTYMAFVHLRVSDLARSKAFYEQQLGFVEILRSGEKVGLAAARDQRPILFLSEDRTAKRVHRSPGLYHVAYLYPSRKELAKAFMQLYEHRWPFQGFADHGVSEALYLADPEGNGIELYTDRPRERWRYQDGQLQMGTQHLDLDNLVAEFKREGNGKYSLHPGTNLGHIHLQVSDISKAEEFYHRIVGFDVTVRGYPGALFVSAGGYHHHLGLNTWQSEGTSLPSEKTLGLVSYGVSLGSGGSLNALRKRLQEDVKGFEDRGAALTARDQDGIEVEFVSS